jgi:hypothetical protein
LQWGSCWLGWRAPGSTSLSSCEAEIWATNATSKKVVDFCNLCRSISDSGNILSNILQPTILYNDNDACVRWSYNMTSKAAHHIELWENSIREWVQNKFINVQHLSGKINPADIFTKEMRDGAHFRCLWDSFMSCLSDFNNDSLLAIYHTNQLSPKQSVPSAAKAMLMVHTSSYFSALASSSFCCTFTAFHIFAVLVVSFSGISTGMFHHILYSSGSTHHIGSVWSLPIVPSQLVTSQDFSLGNLPNSF